ncbi:uncharacterized protein B0P05DRAFT_561936 [Gilbertella persicaria]|uniref:uncharacterized protein n=1 Tax=Gilbertella persicaria TaxID=101096 RepID=UPI00221E57AC|nr:uncharacterized protein B0P05DRAFT_561936 [Gilbertella persicaria]KAI8053184.1 hypothetical protein B0P05DRAFT_561936 [Gilbertella persicaria]
MVDYQQEITDLLAYCQNEWVNLEIMTKQKKSTPSIQLAAQDLREGIKQLVQLQDNLDEIEHVVDNKEWSKRADIILYDVKTKLQHATHLTTNIKPMTSQSSPLRLSNTFKKANESISDIKEEDEEEEDDDEFLDASDQANVPERSSKLLLKIEPEASIDVMTSPSPISNQQKESSRPTFGRRSVILTEDTNLEKKPKTSLFPLLKGLRTSQSTPVNYSAPVHINFFKDDNVQKDAKDFIFATDAIVDHPLRIGVGYGSYICYSCTILSDKGAPITVRKRYSDFVDLREELVKQHPTLKRSIPKLPPKKVVGKFTPSFVEQRRKDLEYFFKYVVLHPTLGASPIVRHWIAP